LAKSSGLRDGLHAYAYALKIMFEKIKHHRAHMVGAKLFKAVVRRRHSNQSDTQKDDTVGVLGSISFIILRQNDPESLSWKDIFIIKILL
jgi:hypothetical protein